MSKVPSNDDSRWKTWYADGQMHCEMPEEDLRVLEERARTAGVSVEIYIRRQLGLPDEPPPE